MKIGFIGLGNMGAPMAANLIAAGHQVTGFDVAGTRVEGGTAAGSAAEAASDQEVVITMLPDGAILRAVYAQIVPAAAQGSLFVDCSTVDIDSALAAHEAAAAAGLLSLDAPVSGGVGGAAAATLTFMVGGSGAAFAAGEPVLQKMGKRIVHCGGRGSGQAAKMCNNMILGVSMIGVCEAFVLAEKIGLSHQALFDVASTASGQCWSLTSYCPVPGPVPTSPANNAYKPGFAASLMLKDLKLAQAASLSSGAVTPLGAQAAQLYGLFDKLGHGERDFSAIIEIIRGKLDEASQGSAG